MPKAVTKPAEGVTEQAGSTTKQAESVTSEAKPLTPERDPADMACPSQADTDPTIQLADEMMEGAGGDGLPSSPLAAGKRPP